MLGIIGIIALLTVLALSLLITRLATIALSLTGLSRQAASFQARSAFTGTGFTTGESEKVVNHPVRRRVIMILMILRSAGLVTVLISGILSFVGPEHPWDRLIRLLWLTGGVLTVLGIAHLPVVDRAMEGLMGYALARWTAMDVRDYSRLLKLSGEYGVTEVRVREGDWVEGKRLAECDLNGEGIAVLGIERDDGTYVGAPQASTPVHAGDTLILYGRNDTLRDLDRRRQGAAGDVAHQQSVSEQERHVERQQQQEHSHEQKKARESSE